MAWDWDKLQQQHKASRPGGGSHSQPPGLDDIIEKIRGTKAKIPGSAALIVIAFIIFVLLYTCFYTIAPNEVGVVQRFGAFVRIESPGLNFKLPNGIEKVTKVKVDFTYKEEFGLRTIEPDIRSRYSSDSSNLNESLMLTGDLNVALVPWVVQFRINDPYKFLFKVRNVQTTLRDLSEAAMRLVVGDRSINEVISNRKDIETESKELLQNELDFAETGIRVVNIQLKTTNVPEPVQPSFNEVNQSVQEKERMIYQAREAYNKEIPAAIGNAEKTIKAAEGYALDRVNRAKGDALRFSQQYEEYSKAQDVTRKRMYLESIQEILPKFGTKYIVDADQKNLLPFLNMGEAKGEKK
ncbi:Protein HflK [uncultured Desulfobacterium sp.]|uniref:Protein HflK n=1 Tax=uncultured Desulfobacterium sp. TaxID=201089 RepID=A0A445MRJ8_9BACT|nr:Protein HflK [uncultured Desulfobacterium sp.]